MVTASKIDKDRIYKLRNLSNDELTDYIEKLVLEAYNGVNDSGVIDHPEMEVAIDKLDEITNITLQRNPRSNITEVIRDRKFRYMNLAYLSAIYKLSDIKNGVIDYINTTSDFIKLDIFHVRLKQLLRVYYENYSNYGIMEDLLMDLSDDGLPIDSDIRMKYVYSKKYGMNKHLMDDLDISISVIVEILLDSINEFDKKYLVDDDESIDESIDIIHSNIKEFYKNNDDFDISAYKQTGLLDAELDSIKKLKNDSKLTKNLYMEKRNEIMDLINGNGFDDIAAKDFERYKKDYPDADFDEWIKRKPKYDVKNAKFIYPEISEYEYV